MPTLYDKFTHWDVLVYVAVIVVVIVATRLFAPRYYDKVVAVISVAAFASFLAILGVWVESLSLRIVLVICSLMAAYDFYLVAFAPKKDGNADTTNSG